jgi:hypothetical protein
MTKLWQRGLLAIVLVAFSRNVTLADPTLELIGGAGTNLLILSNLNIGLAVELHKVDPKKSEVVIQVIDQVDKTIEVNVTQFTKWRNLVKLTKEDGEWLDLMLDGLRSVRKQATALRIAVSKNSKSHYDEYQERRKETFALIKKVTA